MDGKNRVEERSQEDERDSEDRSPTGPELRADPAASEEDHKSEELIISIGQWDERYEQQCGGYDEQSA